MSGRKVVNTPEGLAAALHPSRLRLILLIENNLYMLAKEVDTEEEALAIREMFQRPLGVLNQRFGLRSNAAQPHHPPTNGLTRPGGRP